MNKRQKKKQERVHSPNGDDFLVLNIPNHPSVQNEILHEQGIELLSTAFNQFAKGEEIEPIVLGSVNGVMVVKRAAKDANGNYTFPTLGGTLSASERLRKKEIVAKIMERITPVLQAQIADVTYIALQRKDIALLEDIESIIEESNSENVKLVNRLGCIFVQFGNGQEFVI